MISRTLFINLYGGPGSGKSTTAAGIFYEMKKRRMSCEIITEYAKDVTWEGTHVLLENQLHIFSEQYRRQWRLVDKVNYVVCDSPLLLSSVYWDYYIERNAAKYDSVYIALSRRFFIETALQFNNMNYFIKRFKPYDPNGRNQTENEAKDLDKRILNRLSSTMRYRVIDAESEETVVNVVMSDIEKIEQQYKETGFFDATTTKSVYVQSNSGENN